MKKKASLWMRWKGFLYKHGYRPKPGTILYSTSLAFIYVSKDAMEVYKDVLSD